MSYTQPVAKKRKIKKRKPANEMLVMARTVLTFLAEVATVVGFIWSCLSRFTD
jgi:hypothetical protein